nr:uncharacterized protein I203_07550 [Kwoniella mangroviensis CBS 8507]OCF63477.1 hypothetical protein I203_07550 [Kwoniella mangroviensis CBS 8507]
MFYPEELLLTKKNGSFGIIWLAATLGPKNKKITRKQLTTVNLAKTCQIIAEPPEPMALRLSGALLVGVARVYNQNYDIFFTDVTNLNSNLRRSIATDFVTGGSGTGGTVNLDLPGGGKSRIDQITLAQASLEFELGLNLQFHHVDWQNPLNHGRKRRSSSMLSSQATHSQGEEDEESSDDEDEDEDEEGEVGRDVKRKKVSSSPAIGAYGLTTKTRNSIHHPSDSTGGHLYAGIDIPMGEIDLGLELDGMDHPVGDDSFSGPSGRDFDLPEGGNDAGMVLDGGDLVLPSRHPSLAPEAVPTVTTPPPKNAPQDREGSERGSVDDVEQQLVEVKMKKPRKVKKVIFDSTTELDSAGDQEARKRYHEDMNRERAIIESRLKGKTVAATATSLVDGTGGLKFFDPEMKAFFSALTRVETFKWESDLTVHRLGKAGVVAEGDEPERPGDGEFDIFGGGDIAMPVHMICPLGYETSDLQSICQAPDAEYARRISQGSQQGPLPWEEGRRSVTPGLPDLADTSFSPASLRLSIMTPQEARLRSRSAHESSTGGRSVDRRHQRSVSLMSDRPDDDPLLLVRGDDLDLPQDEDNFQLEALAPSQQARLADLPPAFRPEMLATLEKQCRDFFSYVERKMVTLSLEELEFEDLAPVKSKKHVAALAFYDCLTLATKKILSIDQEEAWGTIKVRFAIDSI